MIETYTTTSSDAEFISNHDIESSSEQAHQDNEFDSDEENWSIRTRTICIWLERFWN